MSYRRTVFLLGAGFSAYAGLPLMSDFLRTAKDLLQDPNSGIEPSCLDRFRRILVEYRQTVEVARTRISVNLDNLEDLFGLVDLHAQLDKKVEELRSDLIYVIARTLLAKQREVSKTLIDARVSFFSAGDPRNERLESTVYDFFAKVICTRSVALKEEAEGRIQNAVITLNYDTVLDDSLVRFGVKPDYGLPHSTDCRECHRTGSSIKVLKLHGSINWQTCGREHFLVVDRPLEHLGRRCPDCDAPTLPVLVPPTWNKRVSNPLGSVWREAVRVLTNAQRIVIIGYSFPELDRYVRYLLALGLANNFDLDGIVWCNLDDQAKKRFASLCAEPLHDRLSAGSGQFEFFVNQGELQRFLDHAFPGNVPHTFDEYRANSIK